jgi:DnaA family protein
MQPLQFTLAVTLPEDETLDSFYAAAESPAVNFLKHYLRQPAGQAPVYLFGASGSGKSHLLYAACVQAQEQGLTSQLLTLENMAELSPRLLDNLEQ